MSQASARDHDRPRWYVIRVEGRLDPRWTTWFDGLRLTDGGDGTTTIHGPVPDQAALHGVLQRVRDVGLPLLAVDRADPGPPDAPTTGPR